MVLLKLLQQGSAGPVPPSVRPVALSLYATLMASELTRFVLTRPQALLSLAPVLAPFLHLSHPTRGSIPGPFTKLAPTSEVRKQALEAVWWMERVAQEEEEAGAATKEGIVALRAAADRAVA